MIGLICIGLVGLTGVILLTRQNRAGGQITIAVTPTFLPPTATPTSTITPTPTETALPTPTSTLVVNATAQAAGNQGQPAATLIPGQPTPTPTNTLVVQPPGTPVPPPTPVGGVSPGPAQMPAGGGVLPVGGQGLLMWAALGLLVLLTVGAVNYLKRA